MALKPAIAAFITCAVFTLTGVQSPAVAGAVLTAELSVQDTRKTALQALSSGQFDTAVSLARALIERDANDVAAWFILSRAERNLSRFDPAYDAAVMAWRNASSKDEKFGAALLAAQALASDEKRTRAQFWLRRAAQVAPNDAARQRALADFRYVRGRNPISTNFKFSSLPSSNINNGSKSDTLIIDGLPFLLSGDARALSGLEVTFGFDAGYTRPLSETKLMRVGLRFDSKNYALSQEAKTQAPDQNASDYAFSQTELTFGLSEARQQGRVVTDVQFDMGRTWYAGQPLSDYLRLRGSYRHRNPSGMDARYSLSVEQQWRKDSSARDSLVFLGTGSWSQRIKSGAMLSWNMGLRESMSDSAAIAHQGLMAGLSYQPARYIAGAAWTWTAGVEYRDYEKITYGLNRHDEIARLGVSLFFRKTNYYGFAPTLDFSYTRNMSNVSLYDTEEFGLSLGLRSAF